MKVLMIAVAVLATGAFGAQGKGIEGLPIKVGDSVEEAIVALGTALKPESSRSTPESEAKELRLRTKVYGYSSIAKAGPTPFGSIHHLPETSLA